MAPDRYSNFADLKKAKRLGSDYWICSEDRGVSVLVMAPHGGMIEPYTTELAEAIAGEDLSFYSFMGRQRKNNRRDLHITSHRYDEERPKVMVGQADVVFGVHGHRCKYAEFVMPGGLHDGLRKRLADELADRGFDVREPEPELAGTNAKNICNCGKLGHGLQVEISKALRDRLRDDEDQRSSFVNAVRVVLLEYEVGNGT